MQCYQGTKLGDQCYKAIGSKYKEMRIKLQSNMTN